MSPLLSAVFFICSTRAITAQGHNALCMNQADFDDNAIGIDALAAKGGGD